MEIFNNENIPLRFREWLVLAAVFFILRGSAAFALEAIFYIEKDVDWYATIARNLSCRPWFCNRTWR